MAIVRRRLDPANPPKLTADTRSRLASLSQAQIEQNAIEDLDNPPMNDAELSKVRIAQSVRRVRELTGLSQARFAECYRINVSRLRDWERGRFVPDSVALAYLQVIERAPNLVVNVLQGGASISGPIFKVPLSNIPAREVIIATTMIH